MNDFDYDCLEKKRTARGAYHRKGTTNRKGCRLPHENLTKKELKAMNGACTTMNLNQPMSWERFKTLSPTLQVEYINHIQERFDVGLMNIGEMLFGLKQSTLGAYLCNHNLIVRGRYGRTKEKNRDALQRWIDGEPKTAPVSDTADVPQVTTCEEDFLPNTGTANRIRASQDASETKPLRAHDFDEMFKAMGLEREEKSEKPEEPENLYPLNDMNMTLVGTPVDILATLRMSFPPLLDKDRQYRFTIRVDGYAKGWRPEDR